MRRNMRKSSEFGLNPSGRVSGLRYRKWLIMSLSAIGYFAYNFNLFASQSTNHPRYFAESPLWTLAFLFIAGYLSLLACRLLLMTVDLHYSEQSEKQPFDLEREQRESVFNLPSLLNRSAPKTRAGALLSFVFLLLALTTLCRFSLYWSLQIAENLEAVHKGPGFLRSVGLIILLIYFAASFDRLEYFQISCVLCYVLLPLRQQQEAPSRDTPLILLAMLVQLFSNQLNVLSFAAAAPALTPPRQDVLLKWAVGLIIAEYLLIEWFVPYGIGISKGGWGEIVFLAVRWLCDVSSVHICVRTLTDVIVAWRYGHLSHEVPRFRAKMVPFVIVAVLVSLTFLIRQDANLKKGIECRSYLLASSLMLIVIPYCYHCTVEKRMGQGEFKVAPKWWSYALYAGGVSSLIGYFGFIWQSDTMDTVYSLGIDLGLAVLLLLWHLLGR